MAPSGSENKNFRSDQMNQFCEHIALHLVSGIFY